MMMPGPIEILIVGGLCLGMFVLPIVLVVVFLMSKPKSGGTGTDSVPSGTPTARPSRTPNLTECPACGAELPPQAERCVACGLPVHGA